MKQKRRAKFFSWQINKRGSVLVFSLIVMFIFLVVAIGISDVAVKEIKTSSDTGKSTMAFQTADSGMEIVLEKMKEGPYTTVGELADPLEGNMSCDDSLGIAVISDTLANGTYKLTFKDNTGDDITLCDSGAIIGSIKSKGTYKQITRAVAIDL